MNIRTTLYLNKRILLGCLVGAFLGAGAPIGWMVIRWVQGYNLYQDVTANLDLYAYMLFGAAIVFSGFGTYVGYKEKLLRNLAIRDSLTNLYNRRYFFNRVKEEILKRERSKEPLSIIYFNIDKFRKVNDKYGHHAGDNVLVEISRVMTTTLRSSDVIGRVEGQEFAVLLPGFDAKSTLAIANRLKNVVESLSIPFEPSTYIKITASFGVATHELGMSVVDLIKNSSKALFAAKKNGRNCAELFTP